MARGIICCLFVACVITQITKSSCRIDYAAPHFPPVSSFIYNGEEADPGSFPWQILLAENGEPKCGGSIINNNTVLTAAHCVDGPKPMDLLVIAGMHKMFVPESSQQVLNVSEIMIHENYRAGSMHNDIALLILTSNITYTQFVQPVSLAQKDVTIGTECITSGWGYVDKLENLSDVLKQTTMTMYDPVKCERRLGAAFNRKLMLCTYDLTSDTCQGDSGGPLVCKENGVYYLHGINSFGKPICGHGPDAFVRVTAYLSWIDPASGWPNVGNGVSANLVFVLILLVAALTL